MDIIDGTVGTGGTDGITGGGTHGAGTLAGTIGDGIIVVPVGLVGMAIAGIAGMEVGTTRVGIMAGMAMVGTDLIMETMPTIIRMELIGEAGMVVQQFPVPKDAQKVQGHRVL